MQEGALSVAVGCVQVAFDWVAAVFLFGSLLLGVLGFADRCRVFLMFEKRG